MVGNIPNFTKIDILRCFLKCNKNISRKELAKDLELGEGTVRTILENLKSKQLLDSTKKGHFLRRRGNELLNDMNERISMLKNVALRNLYNGSKKSAVVVRNAENLKQLYKLRDIAVKNLAEGAIILKFQDKLYAPEAGYEQDFKELEKCFDFKDNDVLVISFSNEKRHAENGALAIAVELSNTLKKFISEF